jgi:hypothetical protein
MNVVVGGGGGSGTGLTWAPMTAGANASSVVTVGRANAFTLFPFYKWLCFNGAINDLRVI